jgi:hypothetical protein
MGHDKVVAVEEKIDLDARDAFRVALTKGGERVLAMASAPGRTMRLELDDASISRMDDRKWIRVGGNALRNQARRSPLCASKR